MYDRAANTTNDKVKTSIVFRGHYPLFRKTRGHLIIGKSHPTFFLIIQQKYNINRTNVQTKEDKIISFELLFPD